MSPCPTIIQVLYAIYMYHIINYMRWHKNAFNCALQIRDLTIAYVLVAVTYIYMGIMFYAAFPLNKNCIEDVCILMTNIFHFKVYIHWHWFYWFCYLMNSESPEQHCWHGHHGFRSEDRTLLPDGLRLSTAVVHLPCSVALLSVWECLAKVTSQSDENHAFLISLMQMTY